MNHKEISDNEIIEKYLMGKLNKEEVDKFENHLFFCDKCLTDLENTRIIIDAVSANEERKILDNKYSFQNKKEKKSNERYLYISFALAAALITAIVLIFNPQIFNNKEIIISQYEGRDTLKKILNTPIFENDTPHKTNIIIKKEHINNFSEPSYTEYNPFDSLINEELAYAEIRSIDGTPVFTETYPANNKIYKKGETIKLYWLSNYENNTYKLSILNNKAKLILGKDSILSKDMEASYLFNTSTLKPGLYYWQVKSNEKEEYPHTGKFLIKN